MSETTNYRGRTTTTTTTTRCVNDNASKDEEQWSGGGVGPPAALPPPREYRKGNWTVEETLILINAKKMDEERRVNDYGRLRSSSGELRWKWVENYCWSKGCERSQNQCNDKWDNLLRDYKKIREYELRRGPAAEELLPSPSSSSYWSMDKIQRKQRNLPSNLALQIYQALNEVIAAAQQMKKTRTTPTSSTLPLPLPPPPPPPLQDQHVQRQQPQLAAVASVAAPPPPHAPLSAANNTLPLLPPPPPPPPPPPLQDQRVQRQQPQLAAIVAPPPPHAPPSAATVSTPEASYESETDGDDEIEEADTDGKRRKIRDVGSSIVHSTSILVQTLKRFEKKKEKRHKEIMELKARRIRLEETRNEINQRGITSLVSSVNNLTEAIQALISDKHGGP